MESSNELDVSMFKRTRILLVLLREFSLVLFLLLSLAMCYLLSECIIILIQYWFGFDIVLTREIHRYAFIYPNVILLTLLFLYVRSTHSIEVKHLTIIPFVFYVVYYSLILLIAGIKNSIGWSLYGRTSEGWYYHIGFREHYCTLINRFYEKINLWDTKEIWAMLFIASILLIGTAFIYQFLKKYIARKTQSTHFATPVVSSEFLVSSDIQKTNKFLIGFRELSLVAYLFFSLALCYMVAESIIPIIQRIWGSDYILIQSEFEIYYIMPNVVLLICLFAWLHNNRIKIKFLIPIQIFFYIASHILILLMFGKKWDVFWDTERHYIFYPSNYYHYGLRGFYTNLSYDNSTFGDTVEIWVRFCFVLLMFVGFGIIYCLLRNYIRRKANSSVILREPGD